MAWIKKDIFGHPLFLKRLLIFIFGMISHRRYHKFNKLQVDGWDLLRMLPDDGVLFVSNHQTYFADVAAMLHVFNAALNGQNNLSKPWKYLSNIKTNIYYVAAKETMESGLLPKLFKIVGAITVERTWRHAGKDVKRPVKFKDISNISRALKDGWVITFPQGTTRAFKPIRKGTAHIIKQNKPIVVPIVIDGFRRAFDRKGLLIKKQGILQTMVIKAPIPIDYEHDTVDEIIEKIAYGIEQHPELLKVVPQEMIEKQEELNKKRRFWTIKDY